MRFRLRQGEEVDLLSAAELTAQIDRLVKALEAPAKPRWVRVAKTVEFVQTDYGAVATVEMLRVNQGQEFRLQRIGVSMSPAEEVDFFSEPYWVRVLRDGVPVDVVREPSSNNGSLQRQSVSPDGAGAVFRNGEVLEVQVLANFDASPSVVTAVVEGSLHLGAA